MGQCADLRRRKASVALPNTGIGFGVSSLTKRGSPSCWEACDHCDKARSSRLPGEGGMPNFGDNSSSAEAFGTRRRISCPTY
jgi:hypothetical protein